jgi:hypothetical protein
MRRCTVLPCPCSCVLWGAAADSVAPCAVTWRSPHHPRVLLCSYETYDELYDYCYRVAGTVALMSVPVMGVDKSYKVGRGALAAWLYATARGQHRYRC